VDSYNFVGINFRGRNLNFVDTSLGDCDMLLFLFHFDLVTKIVFSNYDTDDNNEIQIGTYLSNVLSLFSNLANLGEAIAYVVAPVTVIV